MSEINCQNCNTPLNGQYCAQCGQRNQRRIITVWVLLRELAGDLLEVDSRVWRTLSPLLLKPGKLTVEYLQGRRVHYTPPLRLYLVTSLIFFLLVFINPGDGIDFDDVVINNEDSATELSTEPPPIADESGVAKNKQDICSDISTELEIEDINFEEMMQQVCRNLTAPGGLGRFLNDLTENVPTMMFFFLPVIALFMSALYLLSGRYYVEHLLFLVHFHSFFFLALTLTVVFSRLPRLLPGQGLVSGLLTSIVIIYAPIYLFKAMRRVYQQSRALTAVKYTALVVAYAISMLALLTALAVFTALHVQ